MTKKIELKDRIFLIAMAIITIIGLLLPVMRTYAREAPAGSGLTSTGIIEISEGGKTVRFDAEDLYLLWEYCQ